MRLSACLLLLAACSDDDATRTEVVCGDGGVTLGREEAAGCNIVNGNLFIRDDFAADLHELSSVREVTGFFRVFRGQKFTDLRGLDNLTRVGDFSIANVPNLDSLKGLGAVRQVGSIVFESNYMLPRAEIEAWIANLESHGSVQILGTKEDL